VHKNAYLLIKKWFNDRKHETEYQITYENILIKRSILLTKYFEANKEQILNFKHDAGEKITTWTVNITPEQRLEFKENITTTMTNIIYTLIYQQTNKQV